MASKSGFTPSEVHPFFAPPLHPAEPVDALSVRSLGDRVDLLHSIAHDLAGYCHTAPDPWRLFHIAHVVSRVDAIHRLVDLLVVQVASQKDPS